MLCSCLLGKMSTVWKNTFLVTLNQWNYELALTYITIGVYTLSFLNIILLYTFLPWKWKVNYYYYCVYQHALWTQESLPSKRFKEVYLFFHLKCLCYPILHNIVRDRMRYVAKNKVQVNVEIWTGVPTSRSGKTWRNVEWRMLHFLLYNINL